MKQALLLLLLCSVAYALPCPTGQAKDGNALAQVEHRWAHALDQQDAATLACILSEEFEDAGPDGQVADRAATLAKVADHANAHPVVHHELSELHPHVQGDFGYIRGLATAVDADGKPAMKVRFTDVYVYREGRWQCVAGHESIVAGASR